MDAFGHRVRLLNCYGPTEATVMVTCADLATFERRKPIPIGRPLPGVRLLVVDSNLKVVPIGVPGELLIGGPKLASGYLNDPEQNRRHFIPDPAAPDERLFRTGDRVRMRPDGQLEFHGRLDDQVKIRGFRTEPAEVEAVLGSHPDVADALVTVATDNHGDATLHAYIVAKPDRDVSSSDVTRYMRQRLPFYQVPQGLKILDRFPLNRTGKIDRTALPVIDPQHELSEKPDRSEDDIDRSVVAIVGEVLGTDVTLRDDFFALGGDSLKAMQVVSRIQQIYSPKFSLIELFDHSGLGALAERIRLLVDAC
jgi:surfactin family lipopeptide synthetase A